MKETMQGLSLEVLMAIAHNDPKEIPNAGKPEDRNMEQLNMKKLKNVTPNKEDNNDVR